MTTATYDTAQASAYKRTGAPISVTAGPGPGWVTITVAGVQAVLESDELIGLVNQTRDCAVHGTYAWMSPEEMAALDETWSVAP